MGMLNLTTSCFLSPPDSFGTTEKKKATMKRLLAATLLIFYATFALADNDLQAMYDEQIASNKRSVDERIIERQSTSQKFVTQQKELSDKICSSESDNSNKSTIANRNKLFFDNLINQLHKLNDINESKFDVLDKKAKNFIDSNEKLLKRNCQGVTWGYGSEIIYLCHVKGPVKTMSVLDLEMGSLEYHKMHLLELASIERLVDCASKSKLRRNDDVKEYLTEEIQIVRELNEEDYGWLNGFYEIVTNYGN